MLSNKSKVVVEEDSGPINKLPNEMLVLIFRHLSINDIIFGVKNVCRGWKELASNASVWRNRSVHYNPSNINVFAESITFCTQVEVLDLGFHIQLDKSAIKALIEAPIAEVSDLRFSSSCRTNPELVNAILDKFKICIKSLTLCLNDEIASFGSDGATCYALTVQRPGVLFEILGQCENLKHLKLSGGCSNVWFCSGVDGWKGLNKLEVLDLSELEEVENEYEPHVNLSATLIARNSGHLKTLYLPSFCKAATEAKQSIFKCQKTIQILGLHFDDLEELLSNLPEVTSLTISGRYLLEEYQFKDIRRFFSISQVLQHLTELTLVQVCDTMNLLLPAISDYCSCLKRFCSEGNTLSEEGLTQLISSMSQLEELNLSNTDALEEYHLVLARLHLPNLKILDITGNGFKSCMPIVRELRQKLPQYLEVRGTTCYCSSCTNSCNSM